MLIFPLGFNHHFLEFIFVVNAPELLVLVTNVFEQVEESLVQLLLGDVVFAALLSEADSTEDFQKNFWIVFIFLAELVDYLLLLLVK